MPGFACLPPRCVLDLKSIADAQLRFRPWIAAGIVTATLIALFGLSRVSFDDNPRAILRSHDDDFRFLEQIFNQFGADENDCFLVVRSESLFARDSLAALRRLVQEVESLEAVDEVTSLVDSRLMVFDPLPRPLLPGDDVPPGYDYEQLRRRALEHPLAAGQLLSDDGRYTLITARLAGDELLVAEFRPVTVALWELADRWSRETPLEVQVTGIPPIRADAFQLVRDESIRYTALGAVAALVMSILIMRRVAPIFVVSVSAITGAIWTVGALGLIGEKLNVLTTVLPMLVMIVGFTDAIHLTFDVRASRARGMSPILAAREAIRHLLIACFLTSVTTTIGFGSLSVTKVEIIRRFGLACALGSVLTFLSVITVMPMLSSTRLGIHILPPRGSSRLAALGRRVVDRGIDGILAARWWITSAGIVAAVLLGILVTRLRPENEIAESLPDDARSIVALRTVDEHLGGMLPVFVAVDWPAGTTWHSPETRELLRRIHAICDRHEAVNHPLSVLNVMQAVPAIDPALIPDAALSRIVRPEDRRLLVVSRSQDRGNDYLSGAFAEIAAELETLEADYPGYSLRLTGSAVFATRVLKQMIVDLALSLGLATVAILLTMTLTYRSLRLGLICLIPNALPLIMTAAVMVVADGTLRFAGVIVFSVCLGIAVDDTIHVVTRFRRELLSCGDVDEALRRSIRGVGAALLTTTMVLMVGLAIPLTSNVPANRSFAAYSCFALASALFSDLVLLPAMLACFGRRGIFGANGAVGRRREGESD